MEQRPIGLICGTTFNNYEGLKDRTDLEAKVDYGDGPVKVDYSIGVIETHIRATIKNTHIILLNRHGTDHHLNPTEVDHLANMKLLSDKNARLVIGVCAVGACSRFIRPGDFVLPTGVYMHNVQPPQYWEKGKGVVIHPGMAPSFCQEELDRIKGMTGELEEQLTNGARVYVGGTVVQIPGNFFSTPEESEFFRRNVPDAALATMNMGREAFAARGYGLPFFGIGDVTDPDNIPGEKLSAHEDISAEGAKHKANARNLITAIIRTLSEDTDYDVACIPGVQKPVLESKVNQIILEMLIKKGWIDPNNPKHLVRLN